MTVLPEQSPAEQRVAALRASVAAIRDAAATVELVALSYDDVAAVADAAGATDPCGPHRGRAAWARTRADAQRRLALRMWARAAAVESAARRGRRLPAAGGGAAPGT
ncbi:hypothetical protein ACI78Q_21085 [Geodermatophilus sp. SYSU D00705]